MNTKKFAVSSMYVRLLWDKENKDVLDLIEPFVLQVLRKEYTLGDEVDNLNVADKLQLDYFLSDFPIAVLLCIFNRLAKKSILSKKNGKYKISKKIEFDEEFDNAQDKIKNEMDFIIKEICNELNLDYNNQSNIAEEKILKFLDKYGYLSMISNNNLVEQDDFDMYMISKFIIKQYENKTQVFSYWLQMIEGFMLMQIIYFYSVSEVDIKAKLDKLNIYLDTVLLLRVLGYKTPEENRMGETLIKLLKEHKSSILCFDHNFRELEGIITYYKENIYTKKNPTLEYFDDKQFDSEDIDSILYDLESSLSKKGVKIVDTPKYDKINVDYDECKLRDFLQDRIGYYKEVNLNVDIKSITAIRRLRISLNKQNCDKIENSGAIFVTSNWRLSKAANEYFSKTEDHVGKKNFSVAINDINLTTLIWIKQNSKDRDLPKLRLIQNAYASTRPSPSLINSAIEYVENRKYESDSEKEKFRDVLLLTLREEDTREELMIETKGRKEQIPEFIELKYEEMITAIDENKKLLEDVRKSKERLEEEAKEKLKNAENIKKMKDYFNSQIEKKADYYAKTILLLIFIFVTIFSGLLTFRLLNYLANLFLDNLVIYDIVSSIMFLLVGFLLSKIKPIKDKIFRLRRKMSFKIMKNLRSKEKRKQNPLV